MMSYEAKMLADLKMPSKQEVQDALLIALFNHGGVVKEFKQGEEIVIEIANAFSLNDYQKEAQLTTIYQKEDRVKKSSLWHRLLFRSADSLAKSRLIVRPSQTFLLTGQKEWMLTEMGYDAALSLLGIGLENKDDLFIKSYEVEELVSKLSEEARPEHYIPTEDKTLVIRTQETSLRKRGFRQLVIKTYDYKCAVCGLKICSPNGKIWEVQAAHIVPHSANGKDDILNGIALCNLHHWTFDVGWFSIQNDYSIIVSANFNSLSGDTQNRLKFGNNSNGAFSHSKLLLPTKLNAYPHINAIEWHRNNIFLKK